MIPNQLFQISPTAICRSGLSSRAENGLDPKKEQEKKKLEKCAREYIDFDFIVARRKKKLFTSHISFDCDKTHLPFQINCQQKKGKRKKKENFQRQ